MSREKQLKPATAGDISQLVVSVKKEASLTARRAQNHVQQT
jgi:hypothetical protein